MIAFCRSSRYVYVTVEMSARRSVSAAYERDAGFALADTGNGFAESGGYVLAEAKLLINEPVRERSSAVAYDLLAAANELRRYLRISMLRPGASESKIAVGIAVLDIWHLLDNLGQEIDGAPAAAN